MSNHQYQEQFPVDKAAIRRAARTLQAYKQGKTALENRIVEEERWWKLRHWDLMRRTDVGAAPRPEPTSAWLFNSIVQKHADMMDSYPYPAVLPREADDREEARDLAAVLPVLLEKDGFEQTYSDAAWYKLKHGVSAKGCFWNSELEEGAGDVHIAFIDLLNLFWEPGITNIQDSRDLFIVALKDTDLLRRQYPQWKADPGGPIDVKQYVYDDRVDLSGKSLVVDWYYKQRRPDGRVILQFCKFCGDTLLYASENDPVYAARGYYDHGQYPVTLDVLFPEEGTPVGFGYIAVMKSPQMYIDKLQQSVLENAIMAAKPRFWAKKSVGVNLDQFLDWSQPIVRTMYSSVSTEKRWPFAGASGSPSSASLPKCWKTAAVRMTPPPA